MNHLCSTPEGFMGPFFLSSLTYTSLPLMDVGNKIDSVLLEPKNSL